VDRGTVAAVLEGLMSSRFQCLLLKTGCASEDESVDRGTGAAMLEGLMINRFSLPYTENWESNQGVVSGRRERQCWKDR
jgi:hypothetical protein